MANPTGEAVLAAEWLLIAIAALMIAARLYMRLSIKRLGFQWSDTFLCLSLALCITTASFDIVYYHAGALQQHISVTLVGYIATPAQKEHLNMLGFVSNIPFYVTFYTTKFALLTFYLDLFPIFLKKLRILVWVTVAYCICSLIITLAVNIFFCWPIERNWLQDEGAACPPYNQRIIFYICFGLHIVGEVAIFILPFLMLRHVRLKFETKVGVYVTFALGLVAIAFAVTRFCSGELGQTIPGSTRRFRSLTLIQLYSALDIEISLIVACMPSLRPYLRMFSKKMASITNRSTADKSGGGSRNGSKNSKPTAVRLDNGYAHKSHGPSENQQSSLYGHNTGAQKKSSSATEETWDETSSEHMRRDQGSDIELVHTV